MIYSRAHLEAIAQVCVEADLYVIADEMYSKLVFDGKEFDEHYEKSVATAS